MRVKIFEAGNSFELQRMVNEWINSNHPITPIKILHTNQSSTYIAHEKVSRITLTVFYGV